MPRRQPCTRLARPFQSASFPAVPTGATADAFASDGATYPSYGSLVQPSNVYHTASDKTWSVWEAWDGDSRIVNVRVRNHATNAWGTKYKVGDSPLVDDDHGEPSIFRDAGGYWHVLGGSHVSALHHWVTNAPDDPSAWTERPTLGTVVSYPAPVMVGSKLYLFVRGATDSKYLSLYTATFSAGVETWSGPTPLANIGATRSFYHGNCILKPSTTDIHIVAARGIIEYPSRPVDIFYMVYKTADGSLATVDGSTVIAAGSLPGNSTFLEDNNFRIYTSADNTYNDVPSFCFDEDNNPHVVSFTGPTGGTAFNVFHMMHNGAAWTSPHILGVQANPYGQTSICPAPSNAVRAFWTQAPASGATYSFSGGDFWSAKRLSTGTWQGKERVIYAATYALSAPAMVFNGKTEFRMTLWEVLQASEDTTPGIGTLRGYAWGDTGMLAN